MLIRSLVVRNFRKLRNLVEINDLEPGLTVIVGDNEEGKSTLLKALQIALFDRYNLSGQAVDDMRPFGSEVRPEIEVDLEVDGACYHLKKGFYQSPSALLKSDKQQWQNDHAEERLRELLGFTPSGRGAAKEEHRGLSGLLWVEQGRAFRPLEINQDTRNSLQEAIEGEVGQVLGGEQGPKLIAAVTKQYEKYFTPTGRRKGMLKEAQERFDKTENEVRELEEELSQYHDKVDRLDKLNKTLASYELQGQPARAQRELEKAQDAARKLEGLEGKINTASARLDAEERSLQLAQSALTNRQDKVKKLAKARKEADKAKQNHSEINEEFRKAETQRDKAEKKLKSARGAFDTAKSEHEAARRELKRSDLTVSLEELGRKLLQGEKIDRGIVQDREAAARIQIDEKELRGLKKKERELGEKRAALEAVATTLDFSPSDDQSVVAGGQKLQINRSLRVVERTSLELEGFGGLEIIPGGEDVRTRRNALEELEKSLAADLSRLRYESVDEAEIASREKNKKRADIEKTEALLQGIAPEGLEKLRSTIADMREELASITPDPDIPPISVGMAKEIKEKAASKESEADETQTEAEKKLKGEEKNLSAVQQSKTEAETTVSLQEKEIKKLTREIDEDRQTTTDDDLEKAVNDAERVRESRAKALKKLEEQREKMSPQLVRGELERAEQARSELEKQISKDKEQVRDLEIELRTIGQKGLGEEIEQRRGECGMAEQELKRLELDAKAWELLKKTLQGAESEAKERFLAPVGDRLKPYLKLLFPATDLLLDEQELEIKALRREGVEEPFTSLSIGTREQVAILVRLALADLLREKGKPVTLVLDDALVNCDDERFRRMELALRRAAENIQILILTCHEIRYQSLGAKIVRLADCKATGR